MDHKEKSFYLEEALGIEGRKYKHENHEDDDGATGIYKDGKLILTEDQLIALKLWSDFIDQEREHHEQERWEKVWDSFAKQNHGED